MLEKKLSSVTSSCIVNEIDCIRINELTQQLKKQMIATDEMHKNRAEEMRVQQEIVFGKLLDEKNSSIIALQSEVAELKGKLKERIDGYKNGKRDVLLMVKKELQQLKEIHKLKLAQITQLKDDLFEANEKIEMLQMEKKQSGLAIEVAGENEINEHFKIISKALRSNQNLLQLIEIETIA